MQLSRCSARHNVASRPACSSTWAPGVKPCPFRPLPIVYHQHCTSGPVPVQPIALHRQYAQSSAGQQRCSRQRVQAAPLEVLADLKALPNWDVMCAAGVAAFAYIWVKVFDGLASRGVLSQKLSRKLVHITSGPLFLLTWPLFR
eukprot:GHUV01015340.1.p1 GENE.GHUV01015340.1~~GHUV01015340.1.p1  ORF type:complete len:144 (+),score=7.79 GHUV01015340.1:390-821(+)